MGALTFTLRSAPPERLDLSDILPETLAGKSVAEIAKLPIGTTRTGVHVGDVFDVTAGDAGALRFVGGSDRFDNVGRSLKGGSITVEGDVGEYLGRGMKAGTIAVSGSVRGPYAGTAMTGGTITVAGDAPDATGGAVSGAMQGMAGGLMVIGGSAGAFLGDRMRRGVIVVLGQAGEAAGARMIGGTIVAGALGRRAGQSMKRGTLIAGAVTDLEPTFISSGTYDHAFLAILRRWLRKEAGEPAAALVPSLVARFRGDMAGLGKGEILVKV